MAIEIVLGLPHLAAGALLATARRLKAPVLISANCLSRWRKADGWREWAGWRTGGLANAHGLASLDLDSAGYTLMAKYHGFPWSIADYMALAASWPFRRFAAADYCCEAEIARDREEVLDRIARTVATNRECFVRADELGIRDRLMPVLQGRTPDDYERCLDAVASMILPGTVVGIGSMCRRAISGPDGLVAVAERISRIMPPAASAHCFGVKGDALPYLAPYSRWITSIDSQAFGIAARQDARRRRLAKTDQLVARHMERWYHRQCGRAAAAPRTLTCVETCAPPSPPSDDPWEQAIAAARAELRDLIETGALDHDEITAGWIEACAADIYHAHAA